MGSDLRPLQTVARDGVRF